MIDLGFRYNQLAGMLTEEDIFLMQDELDLCHSLLVEKAGKGNEFLGWIDQPLHVGDETINSIEEDAKKFRSTSELIIVTGIGGPLTGSKAIIDALDSPFSQFQYGLGNPAVVYAGHSLSQHYHAALIDLLDKKDYSIISVSKPGSNIETAIVLRILKNHIIKKYGPAGATKRILTIAGNPNGSDNTGMDKNGFKSYYVPENMGVVYSAFTAAGLLPLSMAGYNIRALLEGASDMRKACIETSSLIDNPAACYAAVRTSLYRLGFQIELLVNYEPSLHALTQWWKQLFGESEGKGNEGIFPSGADFTGDIYSTGQYIQDGQRILFETIINSYKPAPSVHIPVDESNTDGLNYLTGKSMLEINTSAKLAAKLAHSEGGVPVIEINLPQINERVLGELIYFFQFACGLSGYLSGVNPFTQPGVELYKNNLFALLEKPGFEAEAEVLRQKITEV